MSDSDDLSRRAGEIFDLAAQMSFEDAMQRRLRYHLLRLTAVGLHRDEVEDLGELGHLSFEESDVTGQTAKIKERPGASSLAFAIADIVERARGGAGGPVSRRGVFVGAVLGAYAAVSSEGGMDQTVVAILGAIGWRDRHAYQHFHRRTDHPSRGPTRISEPGGGLALSPTRHSGCPSRLAS